MNKKLLNLALVLACHGCSTKPASSTVHASPGVSSSADHAVSISPAAGADGSATISCSGTEPVPQSDSSGQLSVAMVSGTGTLTFQSWAGMPNGVAQKLSCRQVPGTPDASVFCATVDHAYAASVAGANATIFGSGPAPLATFACTTSGSIPPAQDDTAKIKTGRYVSAMGLPSSGPNQCAFSDQLILDKTLIADTYVVAVVHVPGDYCTPADIAQNPSATLSVVAATLEQCDLKIDAVDTSGRTIEILDLRQTQPPANPNASACASGLGDLSVSTLIPGITSAWRQTAP